jgi:peptide/nickel transport system substrate-binding protein
LADGLQLSGVPRRFGVLAAVLALLGCSAAGTARGRTVIYASGADLQSINPLLTTHPLARQVQRYVLLTTLVRYDSVLRIEPYLARRWDWSPDGAVLTFHLNQDLRWHDGVPTTAHDVAWTLDQARDLRTGYPRQSDLSQLRSTAAPDDSTVRLNFDRPQRVIPDVLTDLAILPRHLLDTVPAGALRQAAWNRDPVGNGPFRFVSHEPNRRWVFAANPDFPSSMGGPPALERFVIAIVDEPMTKLAALTAGELDFAGIQPAHAEFVRQNPRLAVIEYPLLFTYVIVLNTRRPPFDELEIRRSIAAAVNRREIVEGYLFGFGTAAWGPGEAGMAGVAGPRPLATEPTPPASSAPPASFELLTVGSGEAALEQLLQAQFARRGIRTSIRQLELSAFLDRVEGQTPDFQAAVMGVPGDPDHGEVGVLLRMAGLAVPGDTPARLRLLADSVPVVFLYQARGVQGMNRRVHGVRMDLRGELPTVTRWTVDSR